MWTIENKIIKEFEDNRDDEISANDKITKIKGCHI
jgi:hypothetical protein